MNRLTEAKKFTNLLYIAAIHHSDMVEVTLLLFRLLRQDMTMIGVLSLNLTGSRKSESFFSTGISLNFWHFLLFVKLLINRCGRVRYQTRTRNLFIITILLLEVLALYFRTFILLRSFHFRQSLSFIL